MIQIARNEADNSKRKMIARRQFLRYLAGSPLLTAASAGAIGLLADSSHQVLAQSYDVLRGSRRALGPDGIITAPADALDVFEFEPAAKKAVLAQGAPAHWGYLESGVEGDVTRDANHTAYARYNIRVRRLIDARKVDTTVRVFGETWTNPVFLCPVSSMSAFNPESREIGVAKAAGKRGQQMVLSTVGNSTVAELNREQSRSIAPATGPRLCGDTAPLLHESAGRVAGFWIRSNGRSVRPSHCREHQGRHS